MALVKCPDCGRDISDQAPACPHCGRPATSTAQTSAVASSEPSSQKKKSSPAAVGCLGCLGLVVIVGVISVLGESSRSTDTSAPSAPSTPDVIELNAAVRFTGTQFVIRNNDTFAWTNCELEVNPKMFSSGFEYAAAVLAAGEQYSVGALQFANGEGKRFNPFEFKPTSFSVACDTPRGRRFYYGGWE